MILEKLKGLIKNKRVSMAVIIGLFGVMLILFSGVKTGENKTDTDGDALYKTRTEEEIRSLLSKVEGVGKVTVSVNLKSSSRVVYKENRDTDSFGNEKSTVCFSGGEPLKEKVLNPEIGGVLVICEGGGNVRVVSEITRIISGVYGVGANHIAVCELSD